MLSTPFKLAVWYLLLLWLSTFVHNIDGNLLFKSLVVQPDAVTMNSLSDLIHFEFNDL